MYAVVLVGAICFLILIGIGIYSWVRLQRELKLIQTPIDSTLDFWVDELRKSEEPVPFGKYLTDDERRRVRAAALSRRGL